MLLVIPLAACLFKAAQLGPAAFWAAVWTPRARSAYMLTFGVSFSARRPSRRCWDLLIAWVLVRYEWPLKRVVDSLVDLPLALPTAVAGLAYSALYVENGWFGRFLVPLGIHGTYSRLGIVLVLTFIGMPFAVRAVQPVLESLEVDAEEAAHAAGRKSLANVLARDSADADAGDHHRLCVVVCPGDWRIRLGRVRVEQHAEATRKSPRC